MTATQAFGAGGPRKVPRLLGVVLAGGRSSRMGRDKSALPHPAGGTFLEHAISRLRALDYAVVVAGCSELPPAWADQPSVAPLPDPPVDGHSLALGPVAGIVTALRQCQKSEPPADGILVTPVDMPMLTSDHLQSVAKAAGALGSDEHRRADWRSVPPCLSPNGYGSSGSAQPVVATFDGVRLEPLVAVYPLTLLESLSRLAASSDRSLNRWLLRQPHHLHQLPEQAAANVNTPDQYQAALRQQIR